MRNDPRGRRLVPRQGTRREFAPRRASDNLRHVMHQRSRHDTHRPETPPKISAAASIRKARRTNFSFSIGSPFRQVSGRRKDNPENKEAESCLVEVEGDFAINSDGGKRSCQVQIIVHRLKTICGAALRMTAAGGRPHVSCAIPSSPLITILSPVPTACSLPASPGRHSRKSPCRFCVRTIRPSPGA